MASVTSLDQDMRRLRLERYTPKAANEVRVWIEDTLGEQLPAGDLLEALKDGTVLCRSVPPRRQGSHVLTTTDSSTWPYPTLSSSRNPKCPSSRWRIYPISSEPANSRP
jgi:hypothetical protein